jgi:Zn finger protein HypA/HybF involved in hydrogenase expression
MDIIDYEELLARGIRAVRADKHEEAKKYLAFAVRARPQAAQAWLWLAAACTEPHEQIDCLQRVLTFEPTNLPARILLQRLGVGSTGLPPTSAVATNPARAFNCPQCGGHQRFDPAEQSLTCVNCGTAEDLSEVKNAAHDERKLTSSILRKPSGENWALLSGQVKCENCGAITTVSPDQQTTNCPFCDSAKIFTQPVTPDLIPPNAILPFAFDVRQTKKRIKRWLGAQLFAPDDLNKLGRAKELRAIYIPFWTFDGKVEMDYDAEVPHEVPDPTRRGGTRTEWKWERFFFDHRVDDLLLIASHTIRESDLKYVQPFKLSELKEFRPEFLADWQTEVYQVSLADAAIEARKRIHDNALAKARRDAGIMGRRSFNLSNLKVHEPTYKHILLPFWVGAYTYRQKLYRVFVNGQTGKVGGETPIDWVKVVLVVGGVLFVLVIVGVVMVLVMRR